VREWLMKPLPKACGIVKCKFFRKKKGQEYQLYLQRGRRFLMSGHKRSVAGTLNMMVSMVQHGSDRYGRDFLGKMRGNWDATGYTLYNGGLAPRDARGAMDVREEHGVVQFKLKDSEPRNMVTILPKVVEESDGIYTRKNLRPMSKRDGIQAKYERAEINHLDVLINKQPEWDRKLGYHKLDMRDRATEASVKNFVLIRHHAREHYICLFGKIGVNTFNLDVQYPMSLFQAFCFAMASCHART